MNHLTKQNYQTFVYNWKTLTDSKMIIQLCNHLIINSEYYSTIENNELKINHDKLQLLVHFVVDCAITLSEYNKYALYASLYIKCVGKASLLDIEFNIDKGEFYCNPYLQELEN